MPSGRPAGVTMIRMGQIVSLLKVRGTGRWFGYLFALGGAALVTMLLLPFRDDISPLSKGFVYLVIVIVAAGLGGLWPGVLASVVCFFTFNFLFLPPYGTFAIAHAENVAVLFVFLALSVLISVLLARSQERAEVADARRAELQLLQSLSAELVAAPPGREGYEALLRKVVHEFGFERGVLFVREESDELEHASVGSGPNDAGPSLERLPLVVGGRTLGQVVLRGSRPPLSSIEGRILRAFCDELALTLERERLRAIETDAEALRQTDSLRKALLAAVSHDLRSPLAAIKASATDLLAGDTTHEEESVREALESINSETDRLNAVISNLLDMSRIEGGLLKAKIQDVDLEEILTHSVERVRRLWPEVQVAVSGNSRAVVRADPVFVDRAVGNLLENAARSAADGAQKHVEVMVDMDESHKVTVHVVDHGRGIPRGAREHLFTPFYRIDERDPRLGSGLGLAITKGFLSLMEGEVWVEDTPRGGATFSFSLPVP